MSVPTSFLTVSLESIKSSTTYTYRSTYIRRVPSMPDRRSFSLGWDSFICPYNQRAFIYIYLTFRSKRRRRRRTYCLFTSSAGNGERSTLKGNANLLLLQERVVCLYRATLDYIYIYVLCPHAHLFIVISASSLYWDISRHCISFVTFTSVSGTIYITYSLFSVRWCAHTCLSYYVFQVFIS